jgi:hypothetical protein
MRMRLLKVGVFKRSPPTGSGALRTWRRAAPSLKLLRISARIADERRRRLETCAPRRLAQR